MSESVPLGSPGITPRWTSSAKSAIGTAATGNSRVWFTLSHGIVNEVYYPSIDQANTRDLGFLVTDGLRFFSEEKRHARHEIAFITRGVPAYRLTSTCLNGEYRISKLIITDPERDVLFQSVRFEGLARPLEQYHLYALLAPHIDNCGFGNTGWVGEYKGIPMLFAQRGGIALALACSVPFKAMSCGYVGYSDGWQDVQAHKQMTWFCPRAESGNIALTGEIDLRSCHGNFNLVLGFGRDAAKAAHLARGSLVERFDDMLDRYTKEWEDFRSKCLDLGKRVEDGPDIYTVSTAVMKICEAKDYPGGIVASLSIPWGSSKGDEDLGGYHLVWTRDQVEAAGGFLAAGNADSARAVLLYLISTQEADGHWAQNMWLDGTPYWHGIQMDETALPILLADSLRRVGALRGLDVWPMVRKAAAYVIRNGPVTPQDRWEEDGGYSPFTLAVEIAALLAAAEFAEEAGENETAAYLLETADIWNSSIERWTYVTDTELAHQFGSEGYYVRIAPFEVADAASPTYGFVPIKNRPPDKTLTDPSHIISPDALALVRFGLRSADDPRIVNTVKIVDALLKTETATGPVWHRYNGDGYGEHADGSPFDGVGVGRGWPLLAGERAHYELARGNTDEAQRLLDVMERQCSSGGLIPEQVWDSADVQNLELFNGRPSGSAMPLVWAHAEYVKLVRSLHDGRVFDMPPQPVQRYISSATIPKQSIWRSNQKCRAIPKGRILRIEVYTRTLVHWTSDGWTHFVDTTTKDTGLGVYFADLATQSLSAGGRVLFTLYSQETNQWESHDYEVTIVE